MALTATQASTETLSVRPMTGPGITPISRRHPTWSPKHCCGEGIRTAPVSTQHSLARGPLRRATLQPSEAGPETEECCNDWWVARDTWRHVASLALLRRPWIPRRVRGGREGGREGKGPVFNGRNRHTCCGDGAARRGAKEKLFYGRSAAASVFNDGMHPVCSSLLWRECDTLLVLFQTSRTSEDCNPTPAAAASGYEESIASVNTRHWSVESPTLRFPPPRS